MLKKINILILYDAAYSYYITEEDVPHTIYEIEGAKEVAIEFSSSPKQQFHWYSLWLYRITKSCFGEGDGIQ